ncbi:MAG: PIN domain-containing protein [Chloroflexota bacterium]
MAELFERHRRIGIDSNVLIYLFEAAGREADAAQALIDGLDEGLAEGVVSAIVLTEVLAHPACRGDGAVVERYARELRSLPNVRVVPVGDEIAIDAAWGRASGRDLGDAIHMATARKAGATCFVTNDRRITGRAGVEAVLLSDISVPEDPGTAPMGDPGEAEG